MFIEEDGVRKHNENKSKSTTGSQVSVLASYAITISFGSMMFTNSLKL